MRKNDCLIRQHVTTLSSPFAERECQINPSRASFPRIGELIARVERDLLSATNHRILKIGLGADGQCIERHNCHNYHHSRH